MSQYQENATIIRFEQLTDTNVRLTLQTEEIAQAAKPGQFVMIRAGKSKDPLLRRPFSIHQTSSNGRMQVLFKVTGRGTGLLAHCKEGETLSVFGPLGRGFPLIPRVRSVLSVEEWGLRLCCFWQKGSVRSNRIQKPT